MIVTKAVYVHVHVWNRNCTLYCQTIPVLAMCPPYSSRSGLVPLVAYGLHDQYIQVARVAYTCLYQHLIEHCLIHESYMHVHATSFFVIVIAREPGIYGSKPTESEGVVLWLP